MNLAKQTHIKYGLIMCVLLLICLAWLEISGNNKSFDNKSTVFLIYQFIAPAIVWYLGIKEKKEQLKGKLTFKQGILEALKISLVFGIVSPFIFMLYYLFINPTIFEYVKTTYGMANAKNELVILLDMLVQFISALIFGTLYGAVITLFLKTKNKN